MDKPRRIALVTGGSRGLGRATVLGLARRGVDAIFTYNSAIAQADEVAREVEETGRRPFRFSSMSDERAHSTRLSAGLQRR